MTCPRCNTTPLKTWTSGGRQKATCALCGWRGLTKTAARRWALREAAGIVPRPEHTILAGIVPLGFPPTEEATP